MRITKNLGLLLLAVWLIITGLAALLNFSFSGMSTVMAILALAAGVLILVGR
jgi:hypothetical protein